MKLKDKLALITGSSRGIGRAIALAMAKEGANIAVCYRTKRPEAKKVALEISKIGTNASTFQINVVDRKSVKKAVKDVLIENVKEIKARRFNGNFAKEPKGFFLIKVENNM